MANIEALEVVPIDADHCEAVWPLSVEAGWNQNVADWRFMLGAGRGFGCTGPDGKWQASSLVLPLGQKLAWISMVLVTKERRRSGLGTGLLKRCIDEVMSQPWFTLRRLDPYTLKPLLEEILAKVASAEGVCR